ncbi:MAG: MarR family winged helix-turn-helix transcriptional regulator [Candidatus Velthaea sp.]
MIDFIYGAPGHLIRRLQQIAVALFLEETAAFDVTPPQFAALVAVASYPGIDQRSLANAIAIDRSTIGDLVTRLEVRGLVAREPGDDRRTKSLTITPAGQDVIDGIIPHVVRVQERILGALDAGERETFLALLSRVVDIHNELSRAPLARVDES